MKLQALHDGTLYATNGRRVYRENHDSAGDACTFEQSGSLPLVSGGVAGLAEFVQTTTPWKRLLETVVGSYQTANLWPLAPSTFLATTGQQVLHSRDGGSTWRRTLTLPRSSIRMGVLPSGVCRHDGVTYLGEYPLAEGVTPRVHCSNDDGYTWEVALELPEVRHVHSVSADPYGGDIWLTTGDRDDACRLIRLHNGEGQVVGGGTQDWRIVEPAFTRDAVVWGVDCGYAERNRIFKLPRTAIEDAPTLSTHSGSPGYGAPSDRATPEPDTVGSLDSSVYYTETVTVAGREWVVLSTAAECGADSTAPGTGSTRGGEAVVVAACAETGFTDWRTLAWYRRRSPLADLTGDPPRLPSANAYILLAASAERGLFLNPLNTASGNGTIQQIPPSAFRTD